MRFAPLKCLPVDRSTRRFLHEKESLYPNPSFQSAIRDIFHRGSMCSKLLFRSLRATEDNKIRVFVNSLSEAGLPDFLAIKTRIKRSGIWPDIYHLFFSNHAFASFKSLSITDSTSVVNHLLPISYRVSRATTNLATFSLVSNPSTRLRGTLEVVLS